MEKKVTEFSDEPWTFYYVDPMDYVTYSPADVAVCQNSLERCYYFDSLEEAQDQLIVSKDIYEALLEALEKSEWQAAPASITPPPDGWIAMEPLAKECHCGARKTGVKDFMAGHSDWCDVHESKK